MRPHAVHVLLHVPGKVKVDDVLYVGDVHNPRDVPGRRPSRHDDRGLPSIEPKFKGSVKDFETMVTFLCIVS